MCAMVPISAYIGTTFDAPGIGLGQAESRLQYVRTLLTRNLFARVREYCWTDRDATEELRGLFPTGIGDSAIG